MAFDNRYPNRKDHRAPYRKSARFDRSCRPGGRCGWCRGNRLIGMKALKLVLRKDREIRV